MNATGKKVQAFVGCAAVGLGFVWAFNQLTGKTPSRNFTPVGVAIALGLGLIAEAIISAVAEACKAAKKEQEPPAPPAQPTPPNHRA